ncbi:transmembrane protein 151b [Plakobranchus ocellatus]|uniref:Transmembrane protein 151b n=1 Tax=Plakobranchus ocellatus TaxID=259542 RepID=A0AAV4ADI3_9GAST|nr:transmembrane protein 151b [Plakobranchus ocellatus]
MMLIKRDNPFPPSCPQAPVRQSLCGSLRRDGHWKCLCLTLLISGCLAAISWCHVSLAASKATMGFRHSLTSGDVGHHGPCKEGYIYIPVAFVVMLYLVYLVECWHSHARLELRYKDLNKEEEAEKESGGGGGGGGGGRKEGREEGRKGGREGGEIKMEKEEEEEEKEREKALVVVACDIRTVYNNISALQAALPVIWWKATCYHYVRRTRQVMRYRNGDAFTSTQVYYERVDSSTAGAAFNFTRCGVKDISRPLVELEKHAAIKIKVSKGFSFASLDTEMEFEEQRAQFFQEYETRDDYMEGREGMDMVNTEFQEYMIAFKDPNNLPWYVSHAMYWMASVLLLSWPLRVIIEYKTAHLHYHIHKLFGSNYLEGEGPVGESGPLSRVSTMNSAELEMSIRNNNVIVPSYSEAVLFGGGNTREDDMSSLLQTQRPGYGAIKKATTGSKLPRSLTTATLAARSSITGASSAQTSSSRHASNTPAVTMNRVKRFKSCGTFAGTDFVEEAANSTTVRQQIQQLLRDRGHLHRHKGRSSHSISGLSLSNGRARFSVGTPGTPDERVISPTFSTYSAVSYRPGSAQAEFEPALCIDMSRRSEMGRGIAQRSKRYVRPHSVALDVPINEIVSNREVIVRPNETLNNVCSSTGATNGLDFSSSTSVNSPRAQTASTEPRRPGSASFPFSRQGSVSFERMASPPVPVPLTPTSPPLYVDAIMMQRISSPACHQSSSLSQAPSGPLEIGLADHYRREPSALIECPNSFQGHSDSLDNDMGASSNFRKHRPLVVGRDHTVVECDSDNCGDELTAAQFSLTQPPSSPTHHRGNQASKRELKQNKPHEKLSHPRQHPQSQPAQQEKQQQQHYIGAPNPLAMLKPLPKVSSTICDDSEDSYSDCLHGSCPETASLQNVPFQNERLSSGDRRPRSAQRRSISDRPPSPPLPPPHLRDNSDPSSAVSTAAAALTRSSQRGSRSTHTGEDHQETPV